MLLLRVVRLLQLRRVLVLAVFTMLLLTDGRVLGLGETSILIVFVKNDIYNRYFSNQNEIQCPNI